MLAGFRQLQCVFWPVDGNLPSDKEYSAVVLSSGAMDGSANITVASQSEGTLFSSCLSAWSLYVLPCVLAFLWVLQFPQSPKTYRQLTGESKLPVCVNGERVLRWSGPGCIPAAHPLHAGIGFRPCDPEQ